MTSIFTDLKSTDLASNKLSYSYSLQNNKINLDTDIKKNYSYKFFANKSSRSWSRGRTSRDSQLMTVAVEEVAEHYVVLDSWRREKISSWEEREIVEEDECSTGKLEFEMTGYTL